MFSGRITEDISKTAKDAAGSIADKGQRLGQTSAFRTISQVKCKKYVMFIVFVFLFIGPLEFRKSINFMTKII